MRDSHYLHRMLILGLETSCDDTSISLVDMDFSNPLAPQSKVVHQLVASQTDWHQPFGGVFPEVASRCHMEAIRHTTETCLQQAGVSLKDVDGIAATYAPGLIGSLLVGLTFGKALAYAQKKPFIGVNHLEGHLNAPLLQEADIPYPQLGLIISGGHTALYHIKAFGDYRFLGGTRDDAAGEAYDKVAKLLGLGYPGGPIVDKLAQQGNPKAYVFSKPQIPELDFSFSGLKTAVRQLTDKMSPEKKQESSVIADVCASFQEVALTHLIEKTLKAAKEHDIPAILLTGGVACNSRLRQRMKEEAAKQGCSVHVAPPKYCTDNAAMIAYVGGRYLHLGKESPLSLNAVAHLPLNQNLSHVR